MLCCSELLIAGRGPLRTWNFREKSTEGPALGTRSRETITFRVLSVQHELDFSSWDPSVRKTVVPAVGSV